MTADFAALVDRVTALLDPPPRVVTPDEYRAITCNRCGLCCEEIHAPAAPEEIVAMAGDPALDPDRRRWLSGLEPVQRLIGGWRYRCRHFFRDAEGLGVCGIHATRPSVCRDFPYGGVVRGWTECAWHVQIVDAEGNRLDRLPVVR